MGKYLMALDAGTGSVRAVLFDLDGNQLGVSQQEWEHKEDPRFPGSMDFDWVHNWDLASGCIRDVIKETGIDPAEIAAVSTTCMREGILLYDKDYNEIWACANVDARSDDEVVELIKKSPDLEKEIYKVSGQTYALGALPRILWVKNKMPEVYEKAAYVGMFNDWLILKLTGVMSIEPSNGSTTGIFDLATRNWDKSIMEKCGLRTDIFPKVYESGTVVANVSEKAAEITLEKKTSGVLDEHKALIDTILVKFRENMSVKRAIYVEVPAGCVASTYVHHDHKIGALVVVKGSEADSVKEFAHVCCLHLASNKPDYVTKDQVPQSYIDEQTEIFKAQMDADEAMAKKPENVRAGILQGKVNKLVASSCFMDQAYLDNEKITVAQALNEAGKAAGATLSFDNVTLYVLGK